MKLKSLILVALVALLSACTPSLESLVSQYEKAAEEGDVAKAEKIIDKIDQNYTESDMTMEQAQRLATATLQLMLNGGTELMEDAIDEAADAIEDATDEAVDAIEDATDEAVDAVEDALEEIGL